MHKCCLIKFALRSKGECGSGAYQKNQSRDRAGKLEYEEFVKTDSGKRWLDDCKSRNNGQTGDSGDYIYDFYPEILM